MDKTFGLKNKNKSKKVQQFCKQVQETQNKNKGIDAESKKKKKMSKLALTQRLFRTFPNFKLRRRRRRDAAPPRRPRRGRQRVYAAASRRCRATQAKLQQEMELKALFSEGLSITVKKKDLHKKKTQQSGGGGGGAGDYYDENWAESELAKAQAGSTELTLEQRIEKKRQELRDKGVKGTPVTPETFRVWKEKKAKRLLAEKMALQKAETLKKKGKSVLTGRDLYLVQKDVFVDDADAAGDYTRQVVQEEGDELYDENGALIEDAERAPVSVDGVKVDAALYGDDDDLDDLYDLDDD